MDIYGYIWVYRGIYGYNILYGVYIGYIWVTYGGEYGYIWVYMEVNMGIYGYIKLMHGSDHENPLYE